VRAMSAATTRRDATSVRGRRGHMRLPHARATRVDIAGARVLSTVGRGRGSQAGRRRQRDRAFDLQLAQGARHGLDGQARWSAMSLRVIGTSISPRPHRLLLGRQRDEAATFSTAVLPEQQLWFCAALNSCDAAASSRRARPGTSSISGRTPCACSGAARPA
jgi:hypothetical protein